MNLTDFPLLQAQEHPLYAAVQRERVEIAIVLLEAGADPNQTGVKYNAKSPLFEACSRGLLEVVRALVGHGVRVASELEVLAALVAHSSTQRIKFVVVIHSEYPFPQLSLSGTRQGCIEWVHRNC